MVTQAGANMSVGAGGGIPDGAAASSSPEEWVDRYGDYLYRCALVRVREPQLAEDMVQETFLAALKAHGSFEGRSSEKTWLVGILKHKIIDHFRRNARESAVEDVEAMADPNDEMMTWRHWSIFDRPGRWDGNPPEAAEDAAFWKVLASCLEGVPPRLARAFVLREIEDLSTEQICKALDITPTNLWVMLHRARARLRRCLELKWLDGVWRIED